MMMPHKLVWMDEKLMLVASLCDLFKATRPYSKSHVVIMTRNYFKIHLFICKFLVVICMIISICSLFAKPLLKLKRNFT
jgi:hypothetical protein